MYYNNFYPDGLTEQDIDALIAEVFESPEQATAGPTTSALLDDTAARRRARRIERRTVNGTVRTLNVRRAISLAGPDGEEAA